MESSRLTYPDRFYAAAAYAPHKDEAIVGSPSPSLLWDEPFPSSMTVTAAAAGGMGQLRLMCSFGGRIIPCSTGKSLCYLCGEIQTMAVDQHASRADIHACLSRLLLGGRPIMLKYQLPTRNFTPLSQSLRTRTMTTSSTRKMVLAVFGDLIILWMTKSMMDDIHGWGVLFDDRVGDGTVTVADVVFKEFG
ncbi:hypothetical protein ZEAMMB73_Zm00001d041798 [Zea mays]|uniref:Uncharacterized protein n=1 Tax=Zea mays TaxID=4577 RepID=A0A1D6MY98_MAIZE|nr:hypothetical protein ZEAMMB73_Zm00001d041798 [Zea mays]